MSGTANASRTILLLAGIAALGSLATQLIVPALPLLARDLHAGADDAQLVIGVYLLGLGVGQLIAGPTADRIGRRPVLLTGLLLYALASLAAAIAPTLPWLLVARLAQALGGAAGVITSRVLIGDLFAPAEAARRQAQMMAVILISPALAPVLGGFLSEIGSWRMLFAGLAAGGLIGALIAAKALPGTRRTAPEEPISYRASLARLARHRRFLGAVLAIIGSTSALYMFLGTAPFLLRQMHGLGPRDVGLCLMLAALASIAGTFVGPRIEARGDALLAGALILLTGSLFVVALSVLHSTALVAFLVPTTLFGLGAGISGPVGIARIVAAEPEFSGTAVSIAGASQMLFSALAAAALGRLAPVTYQELGLGMTLMALVAIGGAYLCRRAAMQGLAR